jgi:hypothetical protein
MNTTNNNHNLIEIRGFSLPVGKQAAMQLCNRAPWTLQRSLLFFWLTKLKMERYHFF